MNPGCAQHVDEARHLLAPRIDRLPAWHQARAREQAALVWAEAVMLVAQAHMLGAAYEAAAAVFSEKELADLTIANAYNRMAISFCAVPQVAAV